MCNIENCKNQIQFKGLCRAHYRRLQRYGNPNHVVRYKHGLSNTGAYKSWMTMKQRCFYEGNIHYEKYGGRGITVTEKWLGPNGFLNFLKDMGQRPDGMSIDRVDNDGNYEPSNCRWATPSEQRKNQKKYIEVHYGY